MYIIVLFLFMIRCSLYFLIKSQKSMRSEEQIYSNASISTIRSSPFKNTPKNHPIVTSLTSLSKEQQHVLTILSQKCSKAELCITNLEAVISELSGRVQRVSESKQTTALADLKMKQSEFIIGQLKSTLAKQAKKEEKLLEQLESQKTKAEKYREDVYKLEAKNASLAEKITRYEASFKQKCHQAETALSTLQKMRSSQIPEGSKRRNSQSGRLETLQTLQNNQNYAQLSAKVEQFQKQFNEQIEKLTTQNHELTLQVKKLQQSNNDYQKINRQMRRQLQQLGIARYQVQIKLKQEKAQCDQLLQQYNRLVQKSNNNQISLHRQLQEAKVREIEVKNEFKKEKKGFKSYLISLAQHINSSKYFFTSSQLSSQVQQLKKLYDKSLKRKLQTNSRELQYHISQSKKTKGRIQELEAKVIQAESVKTPITSQKDLQKAETSDKYQRVSDNGSVLNNRSSDRSEEEKYRNAEQKYKGRIQNLRLQLKVKQTKINELEKELQSEFQKSKDKILELQLMISEKTNQMRKLQLKYKEKQYQFGQSQGRIRDLETKVKILIEKQENEKQSTTKLLELKSQSYEEKIKLVKSNMKDLQKKEQEKTIKYNKLKARYEKYQLQATQSLKRKNAQIDQLLKQNNRMQAQLKLLQEKINITNIIQGELSKNKTPNTPINQDLIEQIQMQRDRISNQLAEKEKKYMQLIQNNEKLASEFKQAKKENKELRSRIDDFTRQERVLKEENKYAREKIQELSRSKQAEDSQQHTYFKKQLQKSVHSIKKLQKACEKYSQQREQKKKQTDELKKQIQQKQKEIEALQKQIERLKEKKNHFKNQINQQKQSRKRIINEYQRKLSEYATKQQQLIDIINYKNRQGCLIRQSMKGDEQIEEQKPTKIVLKFNIDTMTDTIDLTDKGVNTEEQFRSKEIVRSPLKPIIPSQMLLEDIQQYSSCERYQIKQKEKSSIGQTPNLVNYFNQLVLQEENMDDHFQICQEGQQLNIGKVSNNLQLKESFNVLRQTIQKLFNQEDISISIVKLLPRQLQDDFHELISYIKQKIVEIKSENNLTFIMAEMGNQPSYQDIDYEIQDFLAKESPEYTKLRKILEEKDSLITSLMNEKTEQQNTITEQQTVQEQAERLHVQQYSVLKGEITQQKQNMDKYQLYHESLRNILKKMMNFWIQDEDNYDDFEDNIMLLPTIYKLTSKEMDLMKKYLQKYKQVKNIY